MSNISDSAIHTNITNSRALSSYKHSAAGTSFKRSKDGTLYAAYYYRSSNHGDAFNNAAKLAIKQSTDGGFTWSTLTNAGGDYNRSSIYPGLSLEMLEDDFNNLVLVTTYRGDPLDNTIQIIVVDKTTGTGTAEQYLDEIYQPFFQFGSEFEEFNRQGLFSFVGNGTSKAYWVYADDFFDELKVLPFDFGFDPPNPRNVAVNNSFTYAGPVDAVSTSGVVHIIATTEAATQTLQYIKYTKVDSAGSLGSPSGIVTAGGAGQDIVDIGLAIDGSGTLCTIYGELNTAGTSGTLHYILSSDGGATWPNPSGISFPTEATTIHKDAWAQTVAAASGAMFGCKVMGKAEGGFLVSSIFNEDATGKDTLYVNDFGTTDGQVYAFSGWVQVSSRSDLEITAGEFFRPMNEEIAFVGNKEDTRMAYLVGHGDHEFGNDSLDVSLFQEKLTNAAYPNPLSQDLTTQKNIDFHASGLIGSHTTNYITAFADNGTSGHIARWDPVDTATSDGQGGYTLISEQNTDIFFDILSYGTPTRESVATSSQTALVERDIRKIYFRPDFYLGRIFTVNDGGFLKRTVYQIEHFGVTYEISQIVPRFIDDQIVHYEANAYVIGPSNNPFTRTVLPSET